MTSFEKDHPRNHHNKFRFCDKNKVKFDFSAKHNSTVYYRMNKIFFVVPTKMPKMERIIED